MTACACCDQPGREVEPGVMRCEKHTGRVPCCISSCRRTFSLRADETYQDTTMCTRHWRTGPKNLRDEAARLRKIAKKADWAPKEAQAFSRAWHANRRAIEEGRHIDMDEINKMFGW